MGWTMLFPEMTLRGDINVVFKGHAHELVEEELYSVPPLAVDLVVYCRLGFGQNTFSRAINAPLWLDRRATLSSARESASKSEKKMQGGAYQRAVLLKSLPERAHPQPCNQKMHPKKFFLNAEFFMLLG